MVMRSFAQNMKIVTLIEPFDVSGGGVAPKFVSLRNYGMMGLYVQASAEADSPVLQLRQANNVAGSGIKMLDGVVKYYDNEYNASPQDEEDLWFERTLSNGIITLEDHHAYWIDIKPAQLDVTNDFDCVGVEVEDPGTASNLVGVTAFLWGGPQGIAGNKDHIPSARVNQMDG